MSGNVTAISKKKDDREEQASAEILFSSEIKNEMCDGGLKFGSDESVLYQWTGTHWAVIDPGDLEARAWRWLERRQREKASPRLAMSCCGAAVLAVAKLPAPDRQNVVIPVLNGALDLVQSEEDGRYCVSLRPARRSDGLRYVLACDYIPGQPAPRFLDFWHRSRQTRLSVRIYRST
ncbi:MAG: hypothetical protein ACYDBH_20785 [Acidobacteriaceae bacterium]